MNEARREVRRPLGSARPGWIAVLRESTAFPLMILLGVLPGLYGLTRWDLTPPGPWWGVRGLRVAEGWIWDQTVPIEGSPGGARVENSSREAREGSESTALEVGSFWTAAEASSYRRVAMQPPLYAWLEGICFGVSPRRDPVLSVLPSVVAGAVVVLLTGSLGMIQGGPPFGLVAALLVAFSPALLGSMQRAGPVTLGVALILSVLICHVKFLQGTPGRRERWAVLGGTALGLGLLSVGWSALLVLPIIWLHHLYLRTEAPPDERPANMWRLDRVVPGLPLTLITLGVALALAGPWTGWMAWRYGMEWLDAQLVLPHSPRHLGVSPGWLPDRLILVAPVTLPLALLGVARLVFQALKDDPLANDESLTIGALVVIQTAVVALASSVWSGGPPSLFHALLAVGLALLATRALIDLFQRQTNVRHLIWLGPATTATVLWWAWPELRRESILLTNAESINPATLLRLHLVLDIILLLALVVGGLHRWARRRHDRQQRVLVVVTCLILLMVVVTGVRELRFQNQETRDLLDLYRVLIKRHAERPFEAVYVVNPTFSTPSPTPFLDHSDRSVEPIRFTAPAGGRLRFILSCALPDLPARWLESVDQLPPPVPNNSKASPSVNAAPLVVSRQLPSPPAPVNRLVILHGVRTQLPYSLQSELKLQSIHPGSTGVLDALATRTDDEAATSAGSPTEARFRP